MEDGKIQVNIFEISLYTPCLHASGLYAEPTKNNVIVGLKAKSHACIEHLCMRSITKTQPVPIKKPCCVCSEFEKAHNGP